MQTNGNPFPAWILKKDEGSEAWTGSKQREISASGSMFVIVAFPETIAFLLSLASVAAAYIGAHSSQMQAYSALLQPLQIERSSGTRKFFGLASAVALT